MKIVNLLILILISCFSASFSQTSNYGDKYEFLRLLNDYRASKGLSQLKYDEALENAAKLQCDYNHLQHNEGGHYNSNPNYTTPYNRVYKAGYVPNNTYSNYVCKENCVVYLNVANYRLNYIEKNILESYKSSNSHNLAMLRENIEKIGYFTIYDGIDVYNVIVMAN